jgi:exonuclease III
MELAVLDWNVRGANNPAKRRALQLFFSDKACNVVCLQETKIEVMTRALVIEMLGPRFGDNFLCLPADGVRGGILIACTDDFQLSLNPLSAGCQFCVTGTIVNKADLSSWSITGVYGPQEDDLKDLFMNELRQIKTWVQPKWMLLGDFNLISSAAEKSNANLNLRMLGKFRSTIQDLEVIDYPIVGRRFTWSNEREHATFTRIDRIMVSKEWELVYPQFQLTPASSNVSDHCPLLLSKMERKVYSGFRFEAHWLSHDSFLSVVQSAWEKPIRSQNAIRILHTKLCRTAKALKKWSKEQTRWAKLLSAIADDVIFNLDVVQEDRPLTSDERDLRSLLKNKLLGIAAIDRVQWRQRSRIKWIKEGDANTKFFHLRANGRRRKNHIPALAGPSGPVHDHDAKAQILLEHFTSLLGTRGESSRDLNWESIGLPRLDLVHLEAQFSVDELKSAVDQLHGENAPGPDGFIGNFYKKCFPIVHSNLLAAVNQMHSLKGEQWGLLNTASIVLLPKKNQATDAKDYRPVSLMHSAAKLLCKLLANRLAPEMHKLVAPSQSAFIKGRSIQDNFLYVKNVIKRAHKRKTPLIFLKLDIAKAFDSLIWPFLLKVLAEMGFGQRWRDLIALILASSSSRILLNGALGVPFRHKRGLRQGDPLSPMLFILAMEPLQCLLKLASDQQILSPLSPATARFRASFYADDAALFLNPRKDDISAAQRILHLFGEASGLKINIQKCVAYSVACEEIDLEDVLHDFGGGRGISPVPT